MSKQLSFRARALDSSKLMPVYKANEIPDLPDFAAINRAVPQMPTGMEKEEETEHHLQRALSAQQVYGTAERLVIPIPEIEKVTERYEQLYRVPADYKPPKQFIHVQPWGMDQEIPDYDMDSEDEQWLNKQAKNLRNLNLTPLKFENMMDRLEKGSGQTVVTLNEAKALLKEDDDLTIAVYDYWLNKRLRLAHALIPQVKTEKRDGSTTNNPYVAFRRRTEKMQTRKNRKNDETSYERMLKLRRDLSKALTILELMKRREKSKKELLKLTIEVVEKRYQMSDWDAKALAEALAQRHKIPSLIPIQNQYLNRDWGGKDDSNYIKKKREYKKRKHKHAAQSSSHQPAVAVRPQLPQYSEELPPDPVYSSEEEGLSPVLSASEQETEEDPDGIYAFRRKAGCCYHAPINEGLGNWPWAGQDEGGFGDKRFRYSLSSISEPPRKCVGFVRRRVGRGGRVILDRGFTDWDDYLSELDLNPSSPEDDCGGWTSEYGRYIREAKIPHYRPQTPEEDSPMFGDWGGQGMRHPAFRDHSPATGTTGLLGQEFNVQSFQDHREQLLQMQRQQQEQLLKQETDLDNSSYCLDHSFSSQPTSRFTLDSASAQFAASAVCNSGSQENATKPPSLHPKSNTSQSITSSTNSSSASSSLPLHSPALTALMKQSGPLLHPPSGANPAAALVKTVPSSPAISLSNGPSSKTCGLSTSPAANILQLNYPITPTTVSSAALTPASKPAAIPSSSSSTSVSLPAVTASSVLSTPILSSASLLLTSSPSITLSSSTLLSSLKPAAMKTPVTLGLTMAGRLATPASKGIPAAKALPTQTVAVRKLATGQNNARNDIARENHEAVNNIAKDNIVAMEVT